MGASFAVTALTVKILSSRGGNGGRQRSFPLLPARNKTMLRQSRHPGANMFGTGLRLGREEPTGTSQCDTLPAQRVPN
jgi:hypothetical protein